MKLILRDSEWWRGNEDYSRMVVFDSPQGGEVLGYCCLGVLAKQLGAEPEELCFQEELKECGKRIPYSYPNSMRPGQLPEGYPVKLIDSNFLAAKISSINDDPDLTDEERVERLRPLFRQVWIEVEYRPDE